MPKKQAESTPDTHRTQPPAPSNEAISACTCAPYSQKDVERFLQKVLLPADPADCWLWQGAKHGQGRGYGKFRLKGKLISAHKAAYLIFNGAVAEGMVINHMCVQEQCANPDHLVQCTQADNIAYAIICGRFQLPNKAKSEK